MAGKLDEADFKGIVMNSCPGAGACGGMYTANTMAARHRGPGHEACPIPLPIPPLAKKKRKNAWRQERPSACCWKKISGPGIMTREAFENAITTIMVLGGSTMRIAPHRHGQERRRSLSQDDFQSISDRVPVLGGPQAQWKYLMQDLHEHGGIPAVMKYLPGERIAARLLSHRHRQDPGREPELHPGYRFFQPGHHHAAGEAIKATGHLQILYGNLAADGSVAKNQR